MMGVSDGDKWEWEGWESEEGGIGDGGLEGLEEDGEEGEFVWVGLREGWEERGLVVVEDGGELGG